MKMRKLSILATAGFVATVAFPAISGAVDSTEESTFVVVRDKDVSRQEVNTNPAKEWVIYNSTATENTAVFKEGPGTPPQPTGSLELHTPGDKDKVILFNYGYIDQRVDTFRSLGYDTYRSAGNLQQVAALNLVVDFNGVDVEGGFTTLVFEPVYNTDQGVVKSGEWQTWDAYNGGEAIWWSTRNITGIAKNTYVSWNKILAENPEATILGGVGINQGGSNPTLKTAVDAFTVGTASGTKVYNFEATPEKATNKAQCKNDGYKNFGVSYKNQGECVSSITANENAKKSTKENDNLITRFLNLFGM